MITYMKDGVEPPQQEYTRGDYETFDDSSFQY